MLERYNTSNGADWASTIEVTCKMFDENSANQPDLVEKIMTEVEPDDEDAELKKMHRLLALHTANQQPTVTKYYF